MTCDACHTIHGLQQLLSKIALRDVEVSVSTPHSIVALLKRNISPLEFAEGIGAMILFPLCLLLLSVLLSCVPGDVLLFMSISVCLIGSLLSVLACM